MLIRKGGETILSGKKIGNHYVPYIRVRPIDFLSEKVVRSISSIKDLVMSVIKRFDKNK